MPRMTVLPLAIAALALAAMPAQAQVTVSDAWVRATVTGQKSTGAFMLLRSSTDTTLVGVASAVAKAAELHEVRNDGGLMRMRPMDALELPAGKLVELRPGGYHVMLLDLSETLRAGSTVPLTLTFQGRDGGRTTVSVPAEVRALTAADLKR
jgi:periplasmic copper chaperone A